MKDENDVYFLGGEKKKSSAGKRKYIVASLVILILLVAGGAWYLSENTEEPEGEMLQTVSIHPDSEIARQARFDKDKDMIALYQWLGQNLKYPEGLEEVEARVIVRFVVDTDSTLCDFEVLKAPKEKAFERAVIDLLKKSPKWAPAELADGTKVRTQFTLPVSFQPKK